MTRSRDHDRRTPPDLPTGEETPPGPLGKGEEEPHPASPQGEVTPPGPLGKGEKEPHPTSPQGRRREDDIFSS